MNPVHHYNPILFSPHGADNLVVLISHEKPRAGSLPPGTLRVQGPKDPKILIGLYVPNTIQGLVFGP